MDQAFEIVEHAEDGVVRVAVHGEVDVATAPALRERLFDAVDRSRLVVVDLLAVTFIDSTALGVLIGTQERAGEHGTELRLVLKDARILKVFEITGLTDLFSMFPSVAEAANP